MQFFSERGAGISNFHFAVDVKPLVKVDQSETLTEVDRIAASLAAFGAWSRPEERIEQIGQEVPPLSQSLEKWKRSNPSVFHISWPVEAALRPFGERNILERDGTVVITLSVHEVSLYASVAVDCMLDGFDQAKGSSDEWEPLGKWLLEHRRVILYLDLGQPSSFKVKDKLQAVRRTGGRLILASRGTLPSEELQNLSVMKAVEDRADSDAQQNSGARTLRR